MGGGAGDNGTQRWKEIIISCFLLGCGVWKNEMMVF